MAARDTWRAELTGRDPSTWPTYLSEHSGLPGPRANTELAIAVAELMDETSAHRLIDTGDEYLTMCAAVTLAARAAEVVSNVTLRALAGDARWRVREGVVLGLQMRADTAPDEVLQIATDWAADADPLIQRAAVAAVCEPRLLRTPDRAAAAVAVCRTTTSALAQLPAARRREPGVRTLRQALGYCWSVAVAADPGPGLAAFRALTAGSDHDADDHDGDPDVAWIVAENLRKKRLARLL
jgi:hypothetical protein